jgi:hypothetical protein
LAFSSHYPQTHTHAVFWGVKEQNILTLKLKLTLFFLGVKEENILTLNLKLTLFFLPAKGTVILENNNGRWKQYSGGHYSFTINFYSKR